MQIQWLKLAPNAVSPSKTHFYDAGWDLYTTENAGIEHGITVKLKTGIAVAIPDGWFGLICDRSSMGSKSLKVMGGVIDSSYRGEIMVCLCNITTATQYIKAGDKIAQLLILPVPKVGFVEVDQLGETERGEAGFGSTGR